MPVRSPCLPGEDTMTQQKKPLTAANIQYLLVMSEADKDGSGMRCTALANKLGLSKPSVHYMMNIFCDMGLVVRNSVGVVFFTEEGIATADRLCRYHSAVSEILSRDFSGLSDIKGVACALIANMNESSLEKLCI